MKSSDADFQIPCLIVGGKLQIEGLNTECNFGWWCACLTLTLAHISHRWLSEREPIVQRTFPLVQGLIGVPKQASQIRHMSNIVNICE